jgi:hypothetical protein
VIVSTDDPLGELAAICQELQEVDGRHDDLIERRDEIICELIGTPGLTLDGIAIKAGISQARVVQIRNHRRDNASANLLT